MDAMRPGGAVNLITKRPDLEEISGYVSTDIGDYDKIQIEGAVNVPLSETFAARISGYQRGQRWLYVR